MQTNELIRKLQELDPEGCEQVCVDNSIITHLERQAAYYDGALEVPIKVNGIKGIKVTNVGEKIRMYTKDWEDFIECNINALIEVDFSGCLNKEEEESKFLKGVAEYREYIKDLVEGKVQEENTYHEVLFLKEDTIDKILILMYNNTLVQDLEEVYIHYNRGLFLKDLNISCDDICKEEDYWKNTIEEKKKAASTIYGQQFTEMYLNEVDKRINLNK